ncbi:uncharacterized protein [Rutidosis leptorrhynchoides]|uniref:uncharacterized protein n=1 Tax=Rutidosis leptorrhynchoides TaxID=125765 RepID=UPI003A996F06
MCTYNFLASKLTDKIPSNPNMPIKAVKYQLESEHEVEYAHLRDYLEELRRANPGTTTIVDVQQCDSSSDSSSDNGIYPVAYALVEKEKYDSWLWFLDCLGKDLGLDTRSNFTFISDRQKGLLQAVDRLYPCAEHRYCVKHLHGNMKSKWSGNAYKNHLWKCATSTTVPEFEKNMLALKGFSEPCWIWLNKIAPKHWSKSHFTGRAHSDVLLSNMCEVLNRWLVDARDKPIITCLEFVREYLMKRIVNVINRMSKCQGPLTPAATKIFEGNQKDAHKLTVLWNGDGKYQVNGPHGEQVVVDIVNKVCACRRWELTGIPCKHVVVVLWNMSRVNDETVGPLESWVHRVHWLDTWKNTYNYKINPVNGIDMWRKSDVPTKLLPPIKEATTGRPKKNRKKGVDEKVDLVGKTKLSKKGTINRCGNCKEPGHNKRRCTNASVNTGQGQ